MKSPQKQHIHHMIFIFLLINLIFGLQIRIRGNHNNPNWDWEQNYGWNSNRKVLWRYQLENYSYSNWIIHNINPTSYLIQTSLDNQYMGNIIELSFRDQSQNYYFTNQTGLVIDYPTDPEQIINLEFFTETYTQINYEHSEINFIGDTNLCHIDIELDGYSLNTQNDIESYNFDPVIGMFNCYCNDIEMLFDLDHKINFITTPIVDFGECITNIESHTLSLNQIPCNESNVSISEEVGDIIITYISSTDCPELGDINYDCLINIVDIVFIIDFLLQNQQPTEQQFILSDWNEDGEINIVDIVQMVHYILNN